MVRFLARWAITAAALAVAAQIMDGIWFEGPTKGSAEWHHKLVPLLVVALISCVVTAFVKPLLTFLSIPFILLTLGFFLLVLNALLLKLTAALAGGLGVDFHVRGFWPAVGGAIVISVVTWILDALFGPDDD
ncbi:MAG TPA: phage holin family protein [Nocardioides sp.]|nr:phage holin family protein [Nocardioides sp.]